MPWHRHSQKWVAVALARSASVTLRQRYLDMPPMWLMIGGTCVRHFGGEGIFYKLIQKNRIRKPEMLSRRVMICSHVAIFGWQHTVAVSMTES